MLGRKTDVALRFVEWFSAKGEAFEHNAAAVERHLNALASGNRALAGGGGGGAGSAAALSSSLPRFPADVRDKIFGGDAERAAAYAPLAPLSPAGAGGARAHEAAEGAVAAAGGGAAL